MAVAPEPTPDGYHWLCNSCQWEGRSLMDAKGHLLETEKGETPWSHMPFEAPIGKDGAMYQLARRVMHTSEKPDTVMVLTYKTAKRRLMDLTAPLVESLAARGGRLRGQAD